MLREQLCVQKNSKEKVKSGCSLEGLLEVEVIEGKKPFQANGTAWTQ